MTSRLIGPRSALTAALAVLLNATVITFLLRMHVRDEVRDASRETTREVPLLVSAIHLLFLAAVVVFAHHPVVFMGIFLFFLGFTQAYAHYQNPLILKEGLLVGFFLAGLVVLGGMQQWWLQPIVSSLEPTALFFGALGLTAITDNAALTYLGSLIEGMSDQAKYMLVAGAVAGGGLTVIANAPNPRKGTRHSLHRGSDGRCLNRRRWAARIGLSPIIIARISSRVGRRSCTSSTVHPSGFASRR